MILESFSLHGKVALVTGAGRGLGQGMAVGFAQAGADVFGLDRSESSDETKAQVEAVGRRYRHIDCDLRTATPQALAAIVDGVVDEMGHIDILLNNAGIIRRNDIFDFSESDWDDVLQINLKAAFLLSQAAAKRMAERKQGKIINIASMLSYQGGIRVPSYTAAKHGIAGITLALCNELAPMGVNVNAIAPGYMATDNTAALRADEARNKAILERIPAGRWGTPQDLQGTAVFLASSASDYLHGAIIPVDGGWLSR